MRVGVIGARNVGSTIGRALALARHTVIITSRDVAEARQVAAEIGAEVAESLRAAARGADAVILAVPYTAAVEVLQNLGDEAKGKVIIDVTNRMNPQDPASVLDGSSVAEWLQAAVPEARVVKAFNTVLAARQANPVVDGLTLDGYVAGDDAEARAVALELVRSLGLRPLDVGPLYMARVLEGMGMLNITLNMTRGWPWETGWKLVGPTPDAS